MTKRKSIEVRKQEYIEKFGTPKCEFCFKEHDKFYRGVPNKFCSMRCNGLANGTSRLLKAQEDLKNKYGVQNVSQLPSVAKKISSSKLGKKNPNFEKVFSEEEKKNLSEKMKKYWADESNRKHHTSKIKDGCNTEQEKVRRSDQQQKLMHDDAYLKKRNKSLLKSGNISKLHI
jgi:hypothetical protein